MPRSLITLLVSVGLLLTGHGIQLTLLPLYAKQLGWSEDVISLTAACYFVGFMLGAVKVPRLISEAGYIRVFLCLCGVLAVVILSLSLVQDLTSWFVLRFVTGFGIAGIYVCAESWLNASASFLTRGRILSVYALTTLVGIGIGQTLVGLIDFERLFEICAILMLLALVPVGLFCTDEPVRPKFVATKISALNGLPKFAIYAIVFGGVMTGSIWAVAPLFAESQGLSGMEISMMMNAIVLGGALVQFPLGYLSDRLDRKHILVATSVGCLVVVLALPFMVSSPILFLFSMGLFGGLSLTQFALCSAYANENTTLTRVQVASMVLLLNGAGSVVGPIMVAAVSPYSNFGLLIVSALSMSLLLLVAIFVRDKPILTRQTSSLNLDQISSRLPVKYVYKDAA